MTSEFLKLYCKWKFVEQLLNKNRTLTTLDDNEAAAAAAMKHILVCGLSWTYISKPGPELCSRKKRSATGFVIVLLSLQSQVVPLYSPRTPGLPVLFPTSAGCKTPTELRRWDGIMYDSKNLMFKWNLSAQLGPAPFAGVILASTWGSLGAKMCFFPLFYDSNGDLSAVYNFYGSCNDQQVPCFNWWRAAF